MGSVENLSAPCPLAGLAAFSMRRKRPQSPLSNKRAGCRAGVFVSAGCQHQAAARSEPVIRMSLWTVGQKRGGVRSLLRRSKKRCSPFALELALSAELSCWPTLMAFSGFQCRHCVVWAMLVSLSEHRLRCLFVRWYHHCASLVLREVHFYPFLGLMDFAEISSRNITITTKRYRSRYG